MDPKNLELAEPGYIYPFSKYKGWEFPPTDPIRENAEKCFSDIKNFKTRPNDVILCSTMKSGTHWIHEVLSMLLMQTTEYNSLGPWWELNLEYMRQPETIEQIKSPRIFSTHLPFSFLPRHHIENKYKIVYLNRNPKDRYTSMRFFLDGKLGMPHWTWSDFFTEHIMKDKLYTGWFNYTREMTSAARKNSDFMFPVLYEDLLMDPKKNYTDLARFLEVPFTDQFIDTIVDKCMFTNLKDHKMDSSQTVSTDNASLFRKGKIGDWKNWFTVAQNEQYDALYDNEMKDVDVKFVYDSPKA